MKIVLRMLSFAIILVLLSALLRSGSAQSVEEFSCSEVIEIPPAECQALIALYNSTNGAEWIYNTNWLVTTTPQDWYGVTVEGGFVTQLNLQENGLSGTLPAELGSLSHLVHLYLNDNQLSGTIPGELGSLIALSHLYLQHNQLSGSIPAQLGTLTYLTYLDLSSNLIGGTIPSQLGALSSLEHLFLNTNLLSGSIPPELGNLTQLSRLYLYDNYLTGYIPASLGNLTSMWNLWLSGNQLTGPIPQELSQLRSMEFLRLADNQLSGAIPEAIGLLTVLRQLSLGNNQLTGEIPAALGGMTNLEILSLNNNQLSGPIPTQLGSLANLYELILSSNQLSGSIPPALGYLTNLYILHLNDNQFSGEIPDITSLVNLLPPDDPDGAGLDLDYNALAVPIDYYNPSNPLHVFLIQHDLDWHTLQAFQQLIGTGGGVLTALDLRASFLVPAGALNDNATFTFTPQPEPGYDPGELVFANNSFRLTAVDSLGAPVTSFNLPLTATLSYADTDILHFPEALLALYYWNTSAVTWLDAATTCGGGGYTRDLVANILTLQICHLSDFSLFGAPYLHLYLPIIIKH